MEDLQSSAGAAVKKCCSSLNLCQHCCSKGQGHAPMAEPLEGLGLNPVSLYLPKGHLSVCAEK